MNYKLQKRISSIVVTLILTILCVLWATPTVGLFVSSFRVPLDVSNSGWWKILPHRDWVQVREYDVASDFSGYSKGDLIQIEGSQPATFSQWQDGVQIDNNTRIIWLGTLKVGRIEIQERAWATDFNLTLQNYQEVLFGQEVTYETSLGEDTKTVVQKDEPLINAFLNSLIVTIPATIIPILMATMAAYAFAWLRFKGRTLFFTIVVILLVVPLQIALVPLLRDFSALGINGTFLSVWIAHTGFGMPLAVYLLYNYISQLPRETLESAFIDGASHFTVFTRMILPLSVPVIFSFAIFQFLWVWNDYLVALTFLGGESTVVLTQRLVDLQGSRGLSLHLLPPAAFVSMILPLIIFLALQRFFVRGLLAGSVKG